MDRVADDVSRRPRSPRCRTRLYGLTTLALALSACGGGDDFGDQAGEICDEARADVEQIGSDLPASEKVRRTTAIIEKQRDRLAELDAPDGKQRAFDAYLRRLDRLVELFGDLQRADRKGDQAGAVTVRDQLRGVQREVRATAADAGLPPVCA